MAEYYCDHGAYASALGSTPTWGVPQEGDGSATTVAATASIASILVNAVAVATNTIGICGLTFTAVASGATVTQFNVGATTQIQADNLAAAFNASTTAVAAGVAIGLPQLRNLLYARSLAGGAPANTVQIMMRIGSLSLNHATNSLVAITSGGWGTPPTITNFIGGVGGCWGWFLNSASALGVSNVITKGSYGCWLYKPYVVPNGALPTVYEYVYVRTTGSPNIAFDSATSGSSLNATWAPNIIYDTNTKWAGSAVGTMTFTITHTANNNLQFITAQGTRSETCLRRGNFKVIDNATSPYAVIYFGTGGNAANSGTIVIDGVEFEDNSASFGLYTFGFGGTGSTVECTTYYKNITYRSTVLSATARALMALMPSGARGGVFFDSCYFFFTLTGGGNPGAILVTSTAAGFTCHVAIRNCVFDGYGPGYDLYSTSMASLVNNDSSSVDIQIENCSGVVMPTAYLGIAGNTRRIAPQNSKSLSYSDKSGAFRYENVKTVSEYIPNAGFPTLSAILFDSATAWSMRLAWLPGVIHLSSPGYTTPLKLATRLASAVRQLTLELYIPSALTMTKTTLGYVQFSYTDSTGKSRSEYVSLSDLVAGSGSWIANSASGYTAKKAVIAATAYALAANSEVTAQVVFTEGSPSGSRADLYVDPTFTVV